MQHPRTDRELTGRALRSVCTIILAEHGPCTVAQLIAEVEREGFALAGRPSKTISDGLRWEIEHGRVIRLGRARYGPATKPRQTRAWIAKRVETLRAQASAGSEATADCLPV